MVYYRESVICVMVYCRESFVSWSTVSTCTLKGAWDMSEVPVTHIFYCAWLKTQVETYVSGTLDMSQAP